MSRQNSNTSSVSPMLSSCDPPRSFPCRDIVVLPVRYALCSDKESSLGRDFHSFTRRFCPAPEMRHHYYTLRLLRPQSFLYAYVEGEADMVQFSVNGASELTWQKGNSFMLRAERFWLVVSNLNQSVWLAVSDADWTDEFMNTVRENPVSYMQQFCPATGKSEESLVFSSHDRSGEEFAADVGQLVQEFRDKPGYLRAVHEYTDEIPLRAKSYGWGSTIGYFYATIDIDVEFVYSRDSDIVEAAKTAYEAKKDYFMRRHPEKSENQMLYEESLKLIPDVEHPSLIDHVFNSHYNKKSHDYAVQQFIECKKQTDKQRNILIDDIRNGKRWHIKKERLSCKLYKPVSLER